MECPHTCALTSTPTPMRLTPMLFPAVLLMLQAACAQLDDWGVRIHYPEQEFSKLDTQSTGEVHFGDFADYVIGQQLAAEPCNAADELEAGTVARREASGGGVMKSGRYAVQTDSQAQAVSPRTWHSPIPPPSLTAPYHLHPSQPHAPGLLSLPRAGVCLGP